MGWWIGIIGLHSFVIATLGFLNLWLVCSYNCKTDNCFKDSKYSVWDYSIWRYHSEEHIATSLLRNVWKDGSSDGGLANREISDRKLSQFSKMQVWRVPVTGSPIFVRSSPGAVPVVGWPQTCSWVIVACEVTSPEEVRPGERIKGWVDEGGKKVDLGIT